MQKIVDAKSGRKITVFNKYDLQENENSCPECHRPFKEYDIQRIDGVKEISCPKCGAKLKRI